MSFLRRVLFSRWSVVLFATLVCIAAALAARRHASPPFAGFFGCFAVLCMVYAACAKNAVGRYVFIGLFSLFLALAGMEVYLRWKYPRALPHVVEITENGAPATWSVDDPVTGYKPRPGAAVRSVRKGRADGVVQYDVRYTVDEHSRRKVAQHPEARKAVLFFGCSFTFGEGLTDEDTLPYRVNEKIGGEFQAFNFGYSGYGPHQFLALLESSLPEGSLPEGAALDVEIRGKRTEAVIVRAFMRAVTPNCAAPVFFE